MYFCTELVRFVDATVRVKNICILIVHLNGLLFFIFFLSVGRGYQPGNFTFNAIAKPPTLIINRYLERMLD